MPASVRIKVGPVTSEEYVFTNKNNAAVERVLRKFGINVLKLPETATDVEVLNAINQFAAQRLFNYIRNWHQNQRKQEVEALIDREDPFDLI